MRCSWLKVVAIRSAPAAAAGLALILQLWLLPARLLGGATTQPSSDHRGDEVEAIKASFADLANSDPAVRIDAMNKLMGMKPEALPVLKKVVAESSPLLPAQASVLRQIVTHVFLSGDPYDGNPASGFLGIRMEQTMVTFRDVSPNDAAGVNSSVVITHRMPGFPGARALQNGDVILSILDRPGAAISEPREFALVVMDMGAGTTVNFLILRHGQIMRVAAKLAPRPLDADRGVDELVARRQKRADEYWAAEFASLVKEGVS